MQNIDEILQSVRRKALADPFLARQLIATREEKNPVGAFCRIVTSLGYPLYEMDLVNAGEEYYANMRRSTNGGGENSPLLSGEDDYYEMFLADLEFIR